MVWWLWMRCAWEAAIIRKIEITEVTSLCSHIMFFLQVKQISCISSYNDWFCQAAFKQLFFFTSVKKVNLQSPHKWRRNQFYDNKFTNKCTDIPLFRNYYSNMKVSFYVYAEQLWISECCFTSTLCHSRSCLLPRYPYVWLDVICIHGWNFSSSFQCPWCQSVWLC